MVTEAVVLTMKQIVSTLSSANIACALMGGSAVGFWKHARTTHDVDLLVERSRNDCEPMLKLLTEAGINPKRQPPVLVIDAHAIIPLSFEPPDTYLDIQIDLLLAESDFLKQALSRRVHTVLPRAGIQGDVISCEDLILIKLLAGRIIDQADAAVLLRLNAETLDWDYLKRQVAHLGFGDELHRLSIEAGLES